MENLKTHIYDELVGKTFSRVYTSYDNTVLYFEEYNGDYYKFYHEQDCCESVYIEDICGDLTDLEDAVITQAEETISKKELENGESLTYTFYKFATVKGYVTVRWLGKSNGYYSEEVSFKEVVWLELV